MMEVSVVCLRGGEASGWEHRGARGETDAGPAAARGFCLRNVLRKKQRGWEGGGLSGVAEREREREREMCVSWLYTLYRLADGAQNLSREEVVRGPPDVTRTPDRT